MNQNYCVKRANKINGKLLGANLLRACFREVSLHAVNSTPLFDEVVE